MKVNEANKTTKQLKEPLTKKLKVNESLHNEDTNLCKLDPSYKLFEHKVENCDQDLIYTPVYFLRTHSKNNDPADVQTQIWQCAFEPDPEDPSKYTDIVATCGGTSVCFISVKTGEVILKYNRNTKGTTTENLYALVWSSLPMDDLGLKRMNILAAAGAKATVILIHPEACCCYQIFRTVTNKANAVVCSLLFHPKKASWLFCGHEDGHIQLWDVGVPSPPSYDVRPMQLIKIPAVGGDVYNMVFSQTNDMLIAGCGKGLFAWNIDVEKVKNDHRLSNIEIQLDLPATTDVGKEVDSICLIRDDILAMKCALHGCIYIFNISKHVTDDSFNDSSNKGMVEIKEKDVLTLKWSDTDNYYMNMGVDPTSGTLVCGDDKGSLWVYDVADYIKGVIKSPLSGHVAVSPVDVNIKLEWPELDDAQVEKARKLRLDTYDIVVDKCTVSQNAEFIVAVTSSNMVCIWRRGEHDNEAEEANATLTAEK